MLGNRCPERIYSAGGHSPHRRTDRRNHPDLYSFIGDTHDSKMENYTRHLHGDGGLFADGVGLDEGLNHKDFVNKAVVRPSEDGTV